MTAAVLGVISVKHTSWYQFRTLFPAKLLTGTGCRGAQNHKRSVEAHIYKFVVVLRWRAVPSV